MRDADLTPTGRELKEPAATLVECVDEKGLKHTVIAFDEAFRGHPALTTGVELIMSFMAYPMVTGLVECAYADLRRARFAYPTGQVWTVKEIARNFRQVGRTFGPRATMELCYLAGMVLHEAGETGPLQGCFSHGNLTPWRIGLKADGQLQVFGYGLAQVEMDAYLKGQVPSLELDAIRYAPPERLEAQPEQPSSDFYALTVIAYELLTGRPLFDETDQDAMWEAIKLAKGVPRIAASDLTPALQNLFGSALVYDPDRRLQGQDYVDAVGELLDDPTLEGPTLSALMERIGNQGARSKRKLIKTAGTAAFTPEMLAAIAAKAQEDDEEEQSDTPKVVSRPSRWSSLRATGPSRRGRATQENATTEPRQRRRRSTAPSSEAPPEAPPAAPPRRRRRRSARSEVDVSPTPPSSAAPESDAPPTTPPRRKRRRPAADTPPKAESAASNDASESSTPATDAPPTAQAPAPRRRRRRPAADAPSTPDPRDDAAPRRRRRRPPPDEPSS